MIGQTIGNLVAGGVSGRGRSGNKGPVNGSAEQPIAGEDGGWAGSNVDGHAAGFGDDIVVTAQLDDEGYRSPDFVNLIHFAQYRPNPRARMGHNGGPPLNDPMTLRQAFPGLNNAPGGAIIGLIDNIFDLTGPANATARELSLLYRDKLISDIQSIDPGYRYASADPGGWPSTFQGQMNALNTIRLDRAEAYYRIGNLEPLQTETLRFLQGRVDVAYAEGVKLYEAGRLRL